MEVRDEGYSPSPYTGIDEDEGYSPSPPSVSIPVIRTQFPIVFLLFRTREVFLLSVSAFLAGCPLCPPRFSFLPPSARLCVARIPSVVRSGSHPMGSLLHPSLTLEEALPTYQPDGNSFLGRELF
jgi:hypothetical protein